VYNHSKIGSSIYCILFRCAPYCSFQSLLQYRNLHSDAPIWGETCRVTHVPRGLESP